MTQPNLGYDYTPLIPGQPWRVHDVSRPAPPVARPSVDPHHAPPDATVLFDGTDLTGWTSVAAGGIAPWNVENGWVEVVAGSGDIQSITEFGDCQLHIEFATPNIVIGDSQGRGNSGVFLMGRYEIQVLDGFDNPTYADGSTSAIYGQYPPLVNACRPPGEWQSYDILWTAPRFVGAELIAAPTCTLLHNGLVVHLHRTLIGPTSNKTVADWEPHPPVGPLRLQDHGNPVRFRNIWYRPIEGWNRVDR